MIIIAENLNGASDVIRKIIERRDEEALLGLSEALINKGADYLDVCSGRDYDREYEDLLFLIKTIRYNYDISLFIDSPYEDVLINVIDSGILKPCDVINSASLQGDKHSKIFDAMKGSEFGVVLLSCDDSGIPVNKHKRLDIMKSLADSAEKYGITSDKLYADFCLESVCLKPEVFNDYVYCIGKIKEYTPEINTIAAVSNASFGMPARSGVIASAVSILSYGGIDGLMINPLDKAVLGAVYAAEVLCGKDKNGRNYNKNYRLDRF